MSTYAGKWSKSPLNKTGSQVTVDGETLPTLAAEVPGATGDFGWGHFSPWANLKLLSYSILMHELRNVMSEPIVEARKAAIALTDPFLQDYVARFDDQWSLTSEEIHTWIEKKHSDIWELMTTHGARV